MILLTYNLSPHHTSKKSTWFANTQGLSSAGSLLWSQDLAFTSGCHGAIVVAQKLVFFLPKTSMIRCKWAFFGWICFVSLKRAMKNIWYSTGCYCNVFVHTSLGGQSSKTSANQWRWIRLPGRFPWKFGNTKIIRSDSVRFFKSIKLEETNGSLLMRKLWSRLLALESLLWSPEVADYVFGRWFHDFLRKLKEAVPKVVSKTSRLLPRSAKRNPLCSMASEPWVGELRYPKFVLGVSLPNPTITWLTIQKIAVQYASFRIHHSKKHTPHTSEKFKEKLISGTPKHEGSNEDFFRKKVKILGCHEFKENSLTRNRRIFQKSSHYQQKTIHSYGQLTQKITIHVFIVWFQWYPQQKVPPGIFLAQKTPAFWAAFEALQRW